MATKSNIYNFEEEVAEFFTRTSATRSACDAYAKEHLGGDVTPVTIMQDISSYNVYAGPHAGFVAQFRLKALQLNTELVDLARSIHGPLIPQVEFRGQLGRRGGRKGTTLHLCYEPDSRRQPFGV